HTFISLHLRLDGEVIHVFGFAVAIRESFAKYIDGFELATTGVIVPNVVDRPQMIFSDHGLDTLDRRDRGPHTRFGIESIGAAASAGIALPATRLPFRCIHFPI